MIPPCHLSVSINDISTLPVPSLKTPHPSTCPPAHSFVCPLTHPSIHLPITHLAIHVPTHSAVYTSTHPPTHSSIYPRAHVYPSSPSFVQLPIH